MGTRLIRWAWLPVIALVVPLAIVLWPDGGSAPVGAEDATETPTPTATATPSIDSDGDGCTAAQEAAMGLDDTKWYDFYDVPVPANKDTIANGSKNRAVSMGDVLAVLFYVGTWENHNPNGNGVDYDSVKGSCDWNGDTTPDKEGMCYDRTPGPLPDPPLDAGPPNGDVDMVDVFLVLGQVGLDCGALPGPPRIGGPNAMAVDADPSDPDIDVSATGFVGVPFQVSFDITTASTAWKGYDLLVDHAGLTFIPTSDINLDGKEDGTGPVTPGWGDCLDGEDNDGDTLIDSADPDCAPFLESWTYTHLGGTYLDAVVQIPPGFPDRLQGGSVRGGGATTATGQAVIATFQCNAVGVFPLHLVTSAEAETYTTTLDSTGAPINTDLADATITCSPDTPTPTPTPTDTPTATPTATDTATPTNTPPPTPAPNAMAVDADPSDPDVDASALRGVGISFDVSANVTRAGLAYTGYQAKVQFNPGILQFQWVGPKGVQYKGLGGMSVDADAVVGGDNVAAGSALGSGATTVTGQAHLMRFQCIAEGTSPLHLMTLSEEPIFGSTTVGSGAEWIPTDLADAEVTCASVIDTDGDGCVNLEEMVGAPPPKPGSTGAFNPNDPYDFYDVPVPVHADPVPNGPKNQAINMADVIAVLFYSGAQSTGVCGDFPNGNRVDYDCDKGIDTNGDTVAEIAPDGVPDGRDYDRTPGPPPNPPLDAGPPNGAIDMSDVLVALAQFGLDCSGPP